MPNSTQGAVGLWTCHGNLNPQSVAALSYYLSHRGIWPRRKLPLWALFGPDVTLSLK